MAEVFSDTICALGEGPLWHPREKVLYWFDILGKRLYRKDGPNETHWDFDEHVSAAGWIDEGLLLIASETSLSQFDTETGESVFLHALEIDNAVTRSNDGRADPWGGFWIGTMGKNAEPKAGAIYRFYQGTLTRLYDDITIPNAICFAPDKRAAYFTDTPTRQIMKVALDDDGFPSGAAKVFIDTNAEELNPDGAVVDAAGNIWVAQWGAARVACYDPDGVFQTAIPVGGAHSSCPAFGGDDLSTLYVTSATQDIDPPYEMNGMTFVAQTHATGQEEHRILL